MEGTRTEVERHTSWKTQGVLLHDWNEAIFRREYFYRNDVHGHGSAGYQLQHEPNRVLPGGGGYADNQRDTGGRQGTDHRAGGTGRDH